MTGAAARGRADMAIAAAFVLLLIARIAQHSPFRDELNAWAIALDSSTPVALIGNMHYEGHPALWHAMLWLASFVSASPVMMKMVHAAIAAAIILMVALASPFSRLERALLLGGYFISFEYSVVSRNYGICLLLALVFAQLRTARPERVLGNAALLALLANTNAYGAILSAALALEYAWALLATRSIAALVPAATLYLAGLALAAFTMMPAADIDWGISRPLAVAWSPGHFVKTALKFIVLPFMPVRAHVLDGTFLLEPMERDAIAGLWPHGLAALAIIAAIVTIFRAERRLLLPVGLTVLVSIVFGHAVYSNGIRHWGISFIAVVAALWMLRMRHSRQTVLVPALLALGVVGGLQAVAAQAAAPYSMAGDTARWLRQHQLADAGLAGMPDAQAISVAIELGRAIYLLECGCLRSHMRFSRNQDSLTPDRLPAALARAAAMLKQNPLFLLTNHPLMETQRDAIAGRGFGLTLLTEQTGSRIDEDFYVYAVAVPE
jgi:hypothetical protein